MKESVLRSRESEEIRVRRTKLRYNEIPDDAADPLSGELFKPIFVERSHRAAPERSVEDMWAELWGDFERSIPGETEEQLLARIIDWFINKSR